MDKAPDAFRTISEVADDLDVPQHVLRFWETRFPQIRPMKRGGGRRYYRPDDVALLRGIRHLLYGEGYTIRGVQRLLKDNGLKFVQAVWQPDEAAGLTARAPAFAPPSQPGAEDAELPDAADCDEIAEPVLQTAVMAHEEAPRPPLARSADSMHAAVPRAVLSGEDRQRLQAALHELGECRRLLDAAMKDE